MPFKDKARAFGRAARGCLRALGRACADGFTDAVGWAGVGLLGWGVWLQFGQAWALMTLGALLLGLSLLATVLGGGD